MAISAAPPAAASVPKMEMAPDVPCSTAFQEVINRGRVGLSTPSSVAQVSALTAASEAANSTQVQDAVGKKKCKPANIEAIPPLASTCPISRVPPLSNFSFREAFFFPKSSVRMLEEIKKVIRSTAHFQPPRPKIIVPSRN